MDAQICNLRFGFLKSQFLYFEVLVVEAIEQEVQKIRNNRFSSFGFQKLHKVVVGGRKELYKNFSYHTDSWLFHIQQFNMIVKIFNNFSAQPVKTTSGRITVGNEVLTYLFPFLMHGIDRTRYSLVWSQAIHTFHENISEYNGIHSAYSEWRSQLKARMLFQSA